MSDFVSHHSIMRRIWGRADIVLFIFAGAAAEFALNKAVDWLYFTGKLPANPIGRLFSTVQYARKIIFANREDAHKAIDTITAIHQAVENKRQSRIPDWAYRDVLYMLIQYSIAAHELIERKMTDAEKQDVYDVFYRMGMRMGLQALPANYQLWLPDRQSHLENDLANSRYTTDLLLQYKKHLGSFRYAILVEAQKLVIPKTVAHMLGFRSVKWLAPSVPLYQLSRLLHADKLVMKLLLPKAYEKQVMELNIV